MKNFFYFFLFFFTLEIHTHEFNPAHLVVEQSKIDTNKYEATWMYPYKNIGKRAEVIFSEVCTKCISRSENCLEMEIETGIHPDPG